MNRHAVYAARGAGVELVVVPDVFADAQLNPHLVGKQVAGRQPNAVLFREFIRAGVILHVFAAHIDITGLIGECLTRDKAAREGSKGKQCGKAHTFSPSSLLGPDRTPFVHDVTEAYLSFLKFTKNEGFFGAITPKRSHIRPNSRPDHVLQ